MGTHPIFESDFDCLTESESQTMEKLSLSGFVSLLPNNLIVFAEDGEFDVPVACGKDSVVSGISKKKNTKPHYSIPVKFVFKEDPPITIVKLTKNRFVAVCERKLFLYQLGGGCLDTYILKPNEGAPVRSASSSEENSRFYIGSEDGTISYFKVTNAAINFETKITTPHEVTCMVAGTEELVTCDSLGCIYSWDIQFATPTLNWQLVISPAVSSLDFSCVCLTSESAIIGTFAGEIIVVQKGKVLCSINAHSGA